MRLFLSTFGLTMLLSMSVADAALRDGLGEPENRALTATIEAEKRADHERGVVRVVRSFSGKTGPRRAGPPVAGASKR